MDHHDSRFTLAAAATSARIAAASDAANMETATRSSSLPGRGRDAPRAPDGQHRDARQSSGLRLDARMGRDLPRICGGDRGSPPLLKAKDATRGTRMRRFLGLVVLAVVAVSLVAVPTA